MTGRHFSGFAGSSDLVTIANRALARLQSAADEAQAQCDGRGWFQRGVEWAADSTATDSICRYAAQLQTNHDSFSATVNDPSTSDAKIVEILQAIQRETDISDLLDLARSTSAGRVIGQAVLEAPGTITDWAGRAASTVAGGVLGGMPWWVWAGGALYLAVAVGGLFGHRRA
ncbi:MAG: hypothetical protein EPO08_21050 [Rhodospirillaceae bacterium]|nr:MAG: hypothetical protein EPO08_21050 [Rhodospirillaceae bacterium]